jgi:hypothetical protein
MSVSNLLIEKAKQLRADPEFMSWFTDAFKQSFNKDKDEVFELDPEYNDSEDYISFSYLIYVMQGACPRNIVSLPFVTSDKRVFDFVCEIEEVNGKNQLVSTITLDDVSLKTAADGSLQYICKTGEDSFWASVYDVTINNQTAQIAIKNWDSDSWGSDFLYYGEDEITEVEQYEVKKNMYKVKG